ncbi:hypothetical protein [Pseudohongiella spirulinae]|uniref:Lipoprotein n=1 Tax=Pseudohongiella spirulinae TaxID=1249552 RepID=A0A0S2KG08_9GAMM|nr:hypothetical protein [Pseudohongiella spirulinae]ALO47249.1 hypothetical protein PS2015_2617 [Pseudohongiella spirulinae]
MIKRTGSLVAGMLVALLLSACAGTSAPHPAVGNWVITIDTPIGAMNANLVINEDLSGEMRSQDLGSSPLHSVQLADERVAFAADIDAQGTAMTLAFSGTVEGDSMSGSFNTDFGAIPVTGRRAE